LHLDFEGNPILVGANIFIFIFALGRIDLWYCGMYVARICMACIIGLLDVVGALYVRYLVFVEVTAIILGMKYTSQMLGGGEIIYWIWYYPLPLPALVGYISMLKIIAVTLENTRYMTYNTPTTSSRPIIHAMQILATYMPQYHKSVLLRAKINTFIRTKIWPP
jgi:hypothetical protein